MTMATDNLDPGFKRGGERLQREHELESVVCVHVLNLCFQSWSYILLTVFASGEAGNLVSL